MTRFEFKRVLACSGLSWFGDLTSRVIGPPPEPSAVRVLGISGWVMEKCAGPPSDVMSIGYTVVSKPSLIRPSK